MKFHEISLQFIQGFSNVEISKHYLVVPIVKELVLKFVLNKVHYI